MSRPTRRALLATVAAGVAGTAGCTGPPLGDQANPSPRDTESDGPPPTSSPAAAPEPVALDEPATRWAVRFDGPVSSRPAVADGTVVAGTAWDGFGTPGPGDPSEWILAGLAAADGTAEWTHALAAPTVGGPAVAGGAVHVATGFSNGLSGTGQRLVTLAGGELQWRTDAANGFLSLLAVDDGGRAFVGTSDDAVAPTGQPLFAVEGDDGSRAWTVESGDPFGGRLVDAGLLVDLGGVALEVRETADGRRAWRRDAELLDAADGSVPVAGDVVPVALGDAGEDEVGAIALDDGSVRWTFAADVADPFVLTGACAVAADGGTDAVDLLVATEYDGCLYGLAADDGSRRWRFETDGDTRDGAVAAGDAVLVGDLDGTVYALDAATGDERWRASVGTAVGWLGVTGDTVVVVGAKGTERLVGLALGDGATRWTFETDENLTRPALGDGSVAVGSDAGLLRVLGA